MYDYKLQNFLIPLIWGLGTYSACSRSATITMSEMAKHVVGCLCRGVSKLRGLEQGGPNAGLRPCYYLDLQPFYRFSGNDCSSGLQGPDRFFRIRRLLYWEAWAPMDVIHEFYHLMLMNTCPK